MIMRKAVMKRIKMTKTGKVLYRHAGQNHFNAKESRRGQLRRRAMTGFSPAMARKIKRYL